MYWLIGHSEKDGGCTFYESAMQSEIVLKSKWTSFEGQVYGNYLDKRLRRINAALE